MYLAVVESSFRSMTTDCVLPLPACQAPSNTLGATPQGRGQVQLDSSKYYVQSV